MEKYVHIDEKNKVCVVVLQNEWKETVAKGIARCSDDDTFNESAGLALANARAWKKYFEASIKNCKSDLARCDRVIKMYEEDKVKAQANLDIVEAKAAELDKELKELLSTL